MQGSQNNGRVYYHIMGNGTWDGLKGSAINIGL